MRRHPQRPHASTPVVPAVALVHSTGGAGEADLSEKDSISNLFFQDVSPARSNLTQIFQPNYQTLEGSFSPVSTPISATKYSFCRVFQDLQDLQSFALLRSQNFNKILSSFFVFLLKFEISTKNRYFSNLFIEIYTDFDEILSEFRRFLQAEFSR